MTAPEGILTAAAPCALHRQNTPASGYFSSHRALRAAPFALLAAAGGTRPTRARNTCLQEYSVAVTHESRRLDVASKRRSYDELRAKRPCYDYDARKVSLAKMMWQKASLRYAFCAPVCCSRSLCGKSEGGDVITVAIYRRREVRVCVMQTSPAGFLRTPELRFLPSVGQKP